MEEDKKKKKNKKKKNKQNKATESSVDSASAHVQNHISGTGQNATAQDGNTRDDVVSIINVNQERPLVNGTQVSTLAEAENQYWLEREAQLEEKIKQLQEEKDAYLQKEVILEEKIQQLVKEKDLSFAKEDSLLEQIKQLQNEKAAYVVKEVSLEEKILLLESERDAYILKEASLTEQIAELQIEKEAHTQREVVELEQLRTTMLQENQLLTEKISDLQSQMLNFEIPTALSDSSTKSNMYRVEDDNVESQIEAASTLVEKLITENAELVEKVNELYIELNHRSLQNGISSANSLVGTTESGPVTNSSAVLLDLDDRTVEGPRPVSVADSIHETMQSGKDEDKEERNNGVHLDASNNVIFPNSTDFIEDEILQIPLEENVHQVQLTDLNAANNNEKTEVALSDAPLVGAPFRLISFVAMYVSGADLVEKK